MSSADFATNLNESKEVDDDEIMEVAGAKGKREPLLSVDQQK